MTRLAIVWTFLFALWLLLTPSRDGATLVAGAALAASALLAIAARLKVARPAAAALAPLGYAALDGLARLHAAALYAVDAAFGAPRPAQLKRLRFEEPDAQSRAGRLERLGAGPGALALSSDRTSALVHVCGPARSGEEPS